MFWSVAAKKAAKALFKASATRPRSDSAVSKEDIIVSYHDDDEDEVDEHDTVIGNIVEAAIQEEEMEEVEEKEYRRTHKRDKSKRDTGEREVKGKGQGGVSGCAD